jgi:uncharacterized membrane protein
VALICQVLLKNGEEHADTQTVMSRLRPSAWLAAAASMMQLVTLSWLVNRQLQGAGSRNWDLGIFTQATYQLGRGSGFMSYRGMDILGHHFNAVLFVLAPVSWLGGGARALSLIQVAALVSGAWPAYLLGRDRIVTSDDVESNRIRGRFGLLCALLYLAHPSLTGLSWWMFHPETLALSAILWAWWAAHKRRWWLFGSSVVWIVLCREDLALAMVGFGIAIAIVHRTCRNAKRFGALTALGSFVFWVVITQSVMPARIGTDEPYYVADFWGHLGSTMPEVMKTAVTHPLRSTEPLHGQDGAAFVATLVGPTAALNVLSPLTLAPALPQLAAITLSNDPDSRQVWHHHGALFYPFSILSAVEALKWLRRRRPRILKVYIPLVATCSLLSYLLMAPSVIGVNSGWWKGSSASSVVMHRAAEEIPVNATVAATVTPGNIVANRASAFTWPNPWQKWKRGYEFAPLPSPDTVEYLLILRSELSPRNRDLFQRLTASSGAFDVIIDEQDVVLAKRRN